jgi:hypothetical protein
MFGENSRIDLSDLKGDSITTTRKRSSEYIIDRLID